MTDFSNGSRIENLQNKIGSNKMEILLFSMGTKEIFGINVFKVREVLRTPDITKTPNAQPGCEGIISLRGNIIPIISLAKVLGMQSEDEKPYPTLIVSEFSRASQGFLVKEVDKIIRVSWEDVRLPDKMLTGENSWTTALTQLEDGTIVNIIDVEQVLMQFNPMPDESTYNVPNVEMEHHTILFADDSHVARKSISSVLDKMKIKYIQTNDGKEAWDKLLHMADTCQKEGEKLSNKLSLIMVDAEMPEMDGYVLTKNIKADARFKDIPILMHSSLSSEANRIMGSQAGVDSYVAKFNPEELAGSVMSLLHH